MRQPVIYLILGVSAALIVVLAIFLRVRRAPDLSAENVLTLYDKNSTYGSLAIQYPLDGTLFPPEIVAPTFRWEPGGSGVDVWLVTLTFQDDKDPIQVFTHEPKWTPEPEQWDVIKAQSLEKDADVIITWNDDRKEDGEQTFGLLSQVSPDGRYVVSTVKAQSVFVPMPLLAFSGAFLSRQRHLMHLRQANTTVSIVAGGG